MRTQPNLYQQAIFVLGTESSRAKPLEISDTGADPTWNYPLTSQSNQIVSGSVTDITRSENWVFRKAFSSVPVVLQAQLSEEYRDLGEALGEMTELEPDDEWRIEPSVYDAARFVAVGLMANSCPAPRILSHGPKSVVFNWPRDTDNLYLTVSADRMSALISSPERIKQRMDLSLAESLAALVFSATQPRHLGQSLRLLTGAVSDPSEIVG